MKVPHRYQKALLVDIDGTVVRHMSDCKPREKQRALDGAVKWVNDKYEEGYGIFFFTSRLPEERKKTEKMLDAYGFKYHDIIFGKPYSDLTFIIDDREFKAITVKRNAGVTTVKDKDLK